MTVAFSQSVYAPTSSNRLTPAPAGNRMICVIGFTSSTEPTACTWNTQSHGTQAMTSQLLVPLGGGTDDRAMQLWYILEADIGASGGYPTYNTGSLTEWAFQVNGVNQTTPFNATDHVLDSADLAPATVDLTGVQAYAGSMGIAFLHYTAGTALLSPAQGTQMSGGASWYEMWYHAGDATAQDWTADFSGSPGTSAASICVLAAVINTVAGPGPYRKRRARRRVFTDTP